MPVASARPALRARSSRSCPCARHLARIGSAAPRRRACGAPAPSPRHRRHSRRCRTRSPADQRARPPVRVLAALSAGGRASEPTAGRGESKVVNGGVALGQRNDALVSSWSVVSRPNAGSTIVARRSARFQTLRGRSNARALSYTPSIPSLSVSRIPSVPSTGRAPAGCISDPWVSASVHTRTAEQRGRQLGERFACRETRSNYAGDHERPAYVDRLGASWVGRCVIDARSLFTRMQKGTRPKLDYLPAARRRCRADALYGPSLSPRSWSRADSVPRSCRVDHGRPARRAAPGIGRGSDADPRRGAGAVCGRTSRGGGPRARGAGAQDRSPDQGRPDRGRAARGRRGRRAGARAARRIGERAVPRLRRPGAQRTTIVPRM